MDFRLRSTKNNVNWSSNSNFTLQKRIFFECIVYFQSQNFSQSGLKLPKQIRFKLYCLLCPNERAWLPISQHRKARTPARQFSAQCPRQPAHCTLCLTAWPGVDSAGSSSALQPIDSSTVQPAGTA